MSSSRRFLFIFDFDETLSIRSSYLPVEELASNVEQLDLPSIDERYVHGHRCWNRRMTELHQRLAEQGISTEKLLETFRSLELSPGTKELFRDIQRQNHRIVVLSNACDLVVEECLRAHDLFDLVEKIESNPVKETHPVIIIDDYEQPLQTTCQLCEPNMCKGIVIDRYRNENRFEKMIFVGDGDNDVCAAVHLNEEDCVFAKYDNESEKVFHMYELLKNQYLSELKTELCVWKTIADVHQVLKEKEIL